MKTKTPNYLSVSLFDVGKHDMSFFKSSADLERFYIELSEEFGDGIEQGTTFAQDAWDLILSKGMNKAVFETMTLLNGKMYDRLKGNKSLNPTLNTVMAICIGVGISGITAEELLSKAGYRLSNSLIHQAYRKFLNSHKGFTIFQCNEILDALRLPLIQSREYNEIISERSSAK